MSKKREAIFYKALSVSFFGIISTTFLGYYIWRIPLIEQIFFSVVLSGVGIMTILILIPRFEDFIVAIFQIGIFGIIGFILIISSLLGVVDLFSKILVLFFGVLFCLMSLLLIRNNFFKP